MVASDGAVWLGTDSGIEIRRPDGTEEWIDRIGDAELIIITGLAEDAEGHVWVASGAQWDGAYRWDGRTWEFFGPEQGLAASMIHRIHRDRKGRLWFLGLAIAGERTSQSQAAVYVYQDGRFSPFPMDSELDKGRIYSFAEEEDGTMWFGTMRGLARLRDGEWTRWTKEGSAQLRDGEWTRWDARQALKTDRIFALIGGGEGRLWFADQNQGLGYIDPGGGPRYLTIEDGLIDNRVWELEMDADGTLWLATRGGLCSYRDGVWSHFGPQTGIDARELWPIVASGNRLYAGTAGRGTYVLGLAEAYGPLPRVDIAAPLMDRDRAVLRWRPAAYWGQQTSEQIKTRHRLDRGTWSAWSHQREVIIDGLQPGEHAFQVQAVSLFGRISDVEHSVSFAIPQPFYRQPQFLLPVGILLSVILVLVVTLVERRRRHSAVLNLSEERFRSFFEEAPISLWEHDYSALKEYLDSLPSKEPEALRRYLEGSPSATYRGMKRIRILDANRATLELFRARDREELTARLIHIFRRDSLPAFKEGMVALAQRQTRFSRETVAHDLEGQRLNVILTWSVAPGYERTLERVLVSVLDVTSQRQAAEQMRLSMQTAEEASRAKSEFLANMSHEIRTPMNAIIGMTELALGTDPTAVQRDYLEGVQIAADTLLMLINDILDLSKIEAGKLALENVHLSLRETLGLTVRTLALRAREKGLELTCSVSPDVADALVGDPVRLKQILINLLSNAIKFTEQGEVGVDIDRQAESDEEVDLHIAVRDTGIGIPADKQQTIFEAFSQADSSTTRQYGGTGLGLSITSHLVQMMDGRVWLESEEGKGSTFHVTVRLGTRKPESPDGGPGPVARIEELPSLRILLAEDNELNQKVAVGLLERAGHGVTVAGNGRETLALLERERFDVVLMDVQMPEMDGLEATAAIRERERETGGHVPIVGLTAHAMTGDRERCLMAGMDDYVTKPIGKDQLFAILGRLVAQETGRSSPPPQEEPAAADVLDRDELWERVDGDVELFEHLRELFLRDSLSLRQTMREAIAGGDAESLAGAAHELKGMAANFAADVVTEAAQRLEFMGRGAKLDGAAEVHGELVRALDRLNKELAGFTPPSQTDR